MSDVLALAEVPAARSRCRRGSLAARGWLGWVVPLGLLLFWQVGAMRGWISSTILPSPVTVMKTGWRLAADGSLWSNLEISALRAAAGLVVGGGIGLFFGFSNGVSRFSERFTDTTLQMARNVPHLALIPLVIIWFGIDEGAKLFLVSLGAFFPIYINTLHGIRSVDPQLVEMGKSYGMSRGTLLRRVILPGALPSIFVGLRYALGITWLTLIVAETVNAQSGIGFMAMQAREFQQTDIVVFAILIYALLGKAADSSVRWLETICLQWNPSYRSNNA